MIRTASTTRRPGAILLIVLVLLALFAVVGLTFVLYSQSEATGARIHREAMVGTGDTPDSTAAVNSFFNQLIYDVPDNGQDITSGLRGYGMSRMVFGYNPTGNATNAVNRTPYNGYGPFTDNIVGVGSRTDIINYSGIRTTDRLVDPEHTGSRLTSDAYNLVAAANLTSTNYVGRNSAYTYPDKHNAYVAMIDPVTGRVVVPSFHRPQLFGSLASSNTNWTAAAGRYRILRPRPADHLRDTQDGRGNVSDFPYPPQNPDGTVTGDVQNFRWGNGTQQNDSVWIHANLPTVKWRGRELQPLVAPLIVPMDGRINLAVAGNRVNGGNHSSHQGFGPWELNPAHDDPADANTLAKKLAAAGINYNQDIQSIIAYRHNNQQKPLTAPKAGSVNSLNFIPPVSGGTLETMNDWAPVNWDAINPQPIPYTTNLRTDPVYPAAGWDNNQTNGAMQHPSLYNPYFELETATAGVGGRTLKHLDIRQTAYRYSNKGSGYSSPLYGITAAVNSFTGSAPNHPGNLARGLTTPVSNSFSYSGAAPSFANTSATSNNVRLQAPPNVQFPPHLVTTAATTILNPTVPPTAVNDSPTGGGYRSLLANFGPIDLNRHLFDYRGSNQTTTLANLAGNPANIVPNIIPANRERNAFAKEIFDRLILATGAPYDSAGFNLSTNKFELQVAGAAMTAGKTDILRYLAQVAVNIVDQIDNDDVCTAFVWNPVNPNLPNGPENDPQNFQPATIGSRVVYGVEKTRLVLNEAYAEATNDPADPGLPQQHAQSPFQVRFFVEVMNPLNAPVNRTGGANPTQNAPLGKGDAQLRIGAHSVYRFQVFTDSQSVVGQLFQSPTVASNVTGSVGIPPRLEVTVPPVVANPNVEPNDGRIGNPNANEGFRHVYHSGTNNSSESVVFARSNNPGEFNVGNAVEVPAQGGTNQLYYTVPVVKPQDIDKYFNGTANPPTNNLNLPGGGGKHSVVLQRLANPYIGFDAVQNPYITVDSLHDIRVMDAIQYGERRSITPPLPGNRPPGTPSPAANANGTKARRGPMYAFRGTTPTDSFSGIAQARSFLSHTPNRFGQFDWLNHLDRKLVNPTELFNVAGVKPHEVLHYFATGATGNVTNKQAHLAPWFRDSTNPMNNAVLYRALSMLEVKPFMYGIPLGGRQPGKINVNAIWHKDVLKAALDAQGGNMFTDAEVDQIWNTLFTTRTPTMPNVNEGLDRPFKSIGTTMANAATGLGLEESILRKDPAATMPMLILPDNGSRPHHYQQEEMLRKLYNNVTTTSDTYMVLFTVGYFEIRATGPTSPTPAATNTDPNRLSGMPVLGKEAFSEIPGDLRVQYGAILDRSMIAADPNALTTPPTNLFMTELVERTDPTVAGGPTLLKIRCTGGNANGLTVDYEGVTTTITRTPVSPATLGANQVSTLVIGSGANAATQVIPGPGNPAGPATFTYVPGSGVGTISFPSGTFVNQPSFAKGAVPIPPTPPGILVTNVLISNPGPQSSLDVNSPAARLIIRDLQRLR